MSKKIATMTPMYDRVIVRRLGKAADTSTGGIYIPEQAKEKPVEGEVVAVGAGKLVDGKLVPLLVGVGDTVLFGKYAGAEVQLAGEELLIMREDEILAVLGHA